MMKLLHRQGTTSQPQNNHILQRFNTPRRGLPPFPPFDPLTDSATVSQRWKKWIRRFENLLFSLREFDSTNDIFDTLPDTGTTYESAVAIFYSSRK